MAEAKKQVFGRVAIDMIAGPSEILIVADRHSDPRHVAADLLSQAEHDKLASAVLVTDDMALAEAVRDEVERQVRRLPRVEIASASIDKNGKIIVADTLDRVIDIANALAPEHLELCVDNPFDYLDALQGDRVYMKKEYLQEYGKFVENSVVYDEKFNILVCVMQDVTEREQAAQEKQELIEKTLRITDTVIEHNMKTVHEIASLLGETAAETKAALLSLKDTVGSREE